VWDAKAMPSFRHHDIKSPLNAKGLRSRKEPRLMSECMMSGATSVVNATTNIRRC